MNRRLVLAISTATLAISAGAFFVVRYHPATTANHPTAQSRRDVRATVVAEGTVQAVKTTDVSTLATGVVKELDADFNSVVHKGEVVARLDSSAIQAQIDQSRAAVARASAEVDRLRVIADAATADLARTSALFTRQLVGQADFDDARVAADQAKADVKAAEAQVNEARATLHANELTLAQTIITSPTDGIVIARNVDVGQTVVSTMQAQSIFQVAEDLTNMQVDATIDESDVGRVHEGDPVTFTVDAYPGTTFSGTVSQVRLNPQIDQNVVTYDAVVRVSNPDLKLRPGMTASLVVQVAPGQ